MKTPSNFVLRTITGTIFVAAILASMLNFFSFFVVFYILLVLTINEYAKLIKINGIVISERRIGLATFPVIAAFVVCYTGNLDWLWIFISMFMIGVLVMFSRELYYRSTHQMQNVAYSFFAYFYIVLPFACLIYIYSVNPLYVLALFTFVWVHDTFSYLVGMKFGKHKLFEKISPKKTWEGFFGGVVFALLSGFLFHYFSSDEIVRMLEPNRVFKWLGLSVVVVVSAIFGDLFESLLKRSLNVKDSGTILPGHGGLLDRLDSILFAAPATTVYVLCVNL